MRIARYAPAFCLFACICAIPVPAPGAEPPLSAEAAVIVVTLAIAVVPRCFCANRKPMSYWKQLDKQVWVKKRKCQQGPILKTALFSTPNLQGPVGFISLEIFN